MQQAWVLSSAPTNKRMWMYMLTVPSVPRWELKDSEFKVTLGYTANSKTFWAAWDSVSKKETG